MAHRFTPVYFVVLFLVTLRANSQNIYTAAAEEFIFSLGHVETDTPQLKNVVRFSGFFHFQEQVHFDFSNSFGIYSGLCLRNIGLITHTAEGYKIKERSYSLGVPLAIKVGDFKNRFHVAVGGEAEMMFAWKRKIFVRDTKIKNSKWFSDNVNIFNPSVFAEVKFYKGQYIRVKYYLLDFLNYQGLTIPDATLPAGYKFLPDYGKSSQLFSVSIGTVISKRRNGSQNAKPTKTGTSTESSIPGINYLTN